MRYYCIPVPYLEVEMNLLVLSILGALAGWIVSLMRINNQIGARVPVLIRDHKRSRRQSQH